MKNVYARLKGGIKDYRVLFREDSMPDFEFFPVPDVSAAVHYEPLANDIPKGSWQYVTLAAENYDQMVDPYMEKLSKDMDVLAMTEYAGVDVIYGVSGSKTLFRKINDSMKIHENGRQLVSFDLTGPTMNRASFGIDFDGQTDAMYDTENRRLYFRKFAAAKSLFKGMEFFYQDVTLDEKEDFLRADMFAVGPELNLDWISLADTLKIAAIRESGTYDFDDPEVRKKIKIYASNYPSAGIVVGDDGRLIVNDKRDVSMVLKLLEQRFFTSELTGEKFLAGSSKKIAK